MRTSERQAKAWKALLKQAEKAPVVLYFRGVNDKDQPLYELAWKGGQPFCTGATERIVMAALEGTEKT